MNARAVICSAFVLIAQTALARQKTDVIVMANGDRITGEIKGLEAGVLRVDLDYVDGAISVQWLKVARVESRQLFIVQTQDGSHYFGALATSPAETDKLQVTEDAQPPVLIEQAHVVRLEETSKSFFRALSGQIDMGLVFAKGNNSRQANAGILVEYRRELWGAGVAYNSNVSSSSGAATSSRNQIDVTGYRLMPWKNWLYGGLGSFLQSSVQGIDRLNAVGGGVGRYFKNTNRARVSVLAGFAWQSVDYAPLVASGASRSSATGLVDIDARIFVFKKTNFSIRSYIIPSLSEPGRVRLNTNSSYYLKLFKNLNWNLSFYGNWDTRPPVHLPGSDYGYSVGLKWTFGLR